MMILVLLLHESRLLKCCCSELLEKRRLPETQSLLASLAFLTTRHAQRRRRLGEGTTKMSRYSLSHSCLCFFPSLINVTESIEVNRIEQRISCCRSGKADWTYRSISRDKVQCLISSFLLSLFLVGSDLVCVCMCACVCVCVPIYMDNISGDRGDAHSEMKCPKL